MEDFLVEYKYLIHIIDSKGSIENKRDLAYDCINLLHYIQNELKLKYHENEKLFDNVLFFSPSNKHLVGSPYTNPNLKWLLDYVPKNEIDAYLADDVNIQTLPYWRNKPQLPHLRKYAQSYVGLKGSLKNWNKYEEIFDEYKAKQLNNDIITNLMIVRENAQFLITILKNNIINQPRRKMIDDVMSMPMDNPIPTVVAMPTKVEMKPIIKEEKIDRDYNEKMNGYERLSQFEIKDEYSVGFPSERREMNQMHGNDIMARNFNLDDSDDDFETKRAQAKPPSNPKGGFLQRQFF